jgi:CO/xanthine dehydrogenase FAD-binding subunit
LKYAAPTTVEEATGLLASTPDARVFAGATDLIPQMRAGRPEPGTIVDIKRIPRLIQITNDNDNWTIGAAAPTTSISSNMDLRSDLPGLAESAALIGSDQIQNRASLGGNLCNASPAADTVPAAWVDFSRAWRVPRRDPGLEATGEDRRRLPAFHPPHRNGHRSRRGGGTNHPRRRR